MKKFTTLLIIFFYFFSNKVILIANDNFEEIIGVVGNEPVTTYDLSERIKILLKSLNLDDNVENRDNIRKRVIELLIEEKIKYIEAKKEKIEVEKEEVLDFMSFIFGFKKENEKEFKAFLKEENLDYDILFEQIKAELMWKKSTNQRFSGLINPDPMKIEEIINDYEKKLGKLQYDFSEILIFKLDDSWEKTLKSIQKVERILDKSKDFSSVASKFSNAPSSLNSGRLGWVFENQIDFQTLNVVEKLKKNEISQIFKVDSGYKIIQLLDRRKLGEKKNKSYSLISFSSNDESEKFSELTGNNLKCEKPNNNVQNKKIKIDKIDDVKVTDLPLDTRNKLANKKIGEMTEIIKARGKSFIFLVCDIKGGEFQKIDKKVVEKKLFQERLSIMEKTYLNKLKKHSSINFNIE